MIKNMKFSHKILLAASLVVLAAFSLFALYNDYLQRHAIKEDLENYLHEIGSLARVILSTGSGPYFITREHRSIYCQRQRAPARC